MSTVFHKNHGKLKIVAQTEDGVSVFATDENGKEHRFMKAFAPLKDENGEKPNYEALDIPVRIKSTVWSSKGGGGSDKENSLAEIMEKRDLQMADKGMKYDPIKKEWVRK